MAAELNSQREDQLDEIVLAYLKAVDAGETPDHQEIIDRYPELATELAAFFVDQDHANQFSMPVWGLTKDLSVVTRTGGDRAPDEPLPSTVAYQPESRERYTLVRLHAEGGIGRVHLAEDQDLGRQVALKELKPKFADDPTYRARFLEEARITGQLEHPGIVPVHELTTRAGDKKPFYTMRFIKGRTLSHAIKAYHRKREAGETGPLDLRELLNVFVGVCNAVAYAHSRGVIHRDLKPQNIALGDFGEALVLDWGLAKVLGEKNGADSLPPVSLEPEAERGQTMQGSRVGTIPYMAPEQAEGRIDQMDRRTDVYGLGAILYEILTGEPPFTGPEESVVLDRVKHELATPARRRVAATPVALEAVCLKALAKKREDRYSSAKELAQEVERFLGDEPVAAYPEPWVVKARRWLGKHRTFATATSAAVLVATASLVGATVLLTAANQRESKARAKAEDNYRLARDAVDRYFTKVSESQQLKALGLERLRKDLLAQAREFYEQFVLEHEGDLGVRAERGRAYSRLAQITWEMRSNKEAIQFALKAKEVFEELAGEDNSDPSYQEELGQIWFTLGVVYEGEARLKDAEIAFLAGIEIQRRLRDDYPKNLSYNQGLSWNLTSLANIYVCTGRIREAENAYSEGLGIKQYLAKAEPGNHKYQQDPAITFMNLGIVYRELGQHQKAEINYQEAIKISEPIVRDHDEVAAYRDMLAYMYQGLADNHRYAGNMELAERNYKKALEIREKLWKEHPDVPVFRDSLTWLRLASLASRVATSREHATSTTEAWSAAKEEKGNGDILYEAAAVHSLAAKAVSKDMKLTSVEQTRLADHYSTRAVDLLERARKTNLFWDGPWAFAQHVKKDPALESLRGRSDFKKLLLLVNN